MAAPTYATPDELRAELGLDSQQLDDAAAGRLIVKAEDVIDGVLGARPVDLVTGRKVVEDDVEAWQWERLGRATVELASAMQRDPEAFAGQQYDEQEGPDFRVKGRVGARFPLAVSLIDGTGLARRFGRATR